MKKPSLVVAAAGICMSVMVWAEPPQAPTKEGVTPASTPAKDGTKEAAKGEAKLQMDKAILIEAGAEPRRVLRYAPKAGEEIKMISTIKQTFVKGPENLPAMPGLEMEYTAKIDKAESAEGASAGQFVMKREVVDVRVASADADNPMAQAVMGMASQMKGQKRTMTVDPMGRVVATQRVGADGTPMAGAGDRTGLLSERMTAILPTESVGVGAKWKVIQTQDVGGSRTPIEVEIRVTKLTETGFEGEVKMSRASDDTAPSGGVTIERVSGTGTVKVDLKQPQGSEANMLMEMKGTLSPRRGGEGRPIELKIETKTKRGI